jgi:hypothetical protein
MQTKRSAALILLVFGIATSSLAQEPLSAINWLSVPLEAPAKAASNPQPPSNLSRNGSVANQPATSGERPVIAGSTLTAPVTVSVLGEMSLDGLGLLSHDVTGFPVDLWGLGRTAEIAKQIKAMRLDGLPALQNLFMTVLLAEASAPLDTTPSGILLLERIDKLLELGALDQAAALIATAGPLKSIDLMRRSFDVSLLLGNEQEACELVKSAPAFTPALTARVFCLARNGDWPAAALTLQTAKALKRIDPLEAALLERFLDGEALDGTAAPGPPKPVTPLFWRIYEAIGEPLSTSGLPPAFAHAELSDRSGWKAQIEAAERLVRAGALPGNVLLGLYTQREPAASGGVWDRADAFQRLDQAMIKEDQALVDQRLPVAFARMQDVEIETAFASLFADRLASFSLTGDARTIAYQLGLLSVHFERLADSPLQGDDALSLFLQALAKGQVANLLAPNSMARAIQPAFVDAPLPEAARQLIAERRVGEAIFLAMTMIQSGVNGNLVKVTEGLVVLRALGLDGVARRTALELMILERRG